MKKMYMIVMVGFMLILPASAIAAYTCSGTLDYLNQPYDGSVLIGSSTMFGEPSGRVVCSLTADWKGVSPETCKGWLSRLLASYIANKPVTIQYNDSFSACTEQPAWDAASHPWAIY